MNDQVNTKIDFTVVAITIMHEVKGTQVLDYSKTVQLAMINFFVFLSGMKSYNKSPSRTSSRQKKVPSSQVPWSSPCLT